MVVDIKDGKTVRVATGRILDITNGKKPYEVLLLDVHITNGKFKSKANDTQLFILPAVLP